MTDIVAAPEVAAPEQTSRGPDGRLRYEGPIWNESVQETPATVAPSTSKRFVGPIWQQPETPNAADAALASTMAAAFSPPESADKYDFSYRPAATPQRESMQIGPDGKPRIELQLAQTPAFEPDYELQADIRKEMHVAGVPAGMAKQFYQDAVNGLAMHADHEAAMTHNRTQTPIAEAALRRMWRADADRNISIVQAEFLKLPEKSQQLAIASGLVNNVGFCSYLFNAAQARGLHS